MFETQNLSVTRKRGGHVSRNKYGPSDEEKPAQKVEGEAESMKTEKGKKLRKAETRKLASKCQVPGCEVDLAGEDLFYLRSRTCQSHQRALTIDMDGVPSRFCQQCVRIHPLDSFDGEKRGCRKRLARHNLRRQRKKAARKVALQLQKDSRFTEYFDLRGEQCYGGKGVGGKPCDEPVRSSEFPKTNPGVLEPPKRMEATGIWQPMQGSPNEDIGAWHDHQGSFDPEVRSSCRESQGINSASNSPGNSNSGVSQASMQSTNVNCTSALPSGLPQGSSGLPYTSHHSVFGNRTAQGPLGNAEPPEGSRPWGKPPKPQPSLRGSTDWDGLGPGMHWGFIHGVPLRSHFNMGMKIMCATPDALPPNMADQLLSMMQLVPDMMEGAIRPGCVHLSVDFWMRDSAERDSALAAIVGAIKSAERGSPAPWSSHEAVVRLGGQAFRVRDGALVSGGAAAQGPVIDACSPVATASDTVTLLVSGLDEAAGWKVLLRMDGRYLEAEPVMVRHLDGVVEVTVRLPSASEGLGWLEVMVDTPGNLVISEPFPLLLINAPQVAQEVSACLAPRLAEGNRDLAASVLKEIGDALCFGPAGRPRASPRALLHVARLGMTHTLEAIVDAVDEFSDSGARQMLEQANQMASGLLAAAVESGSNETVCQVVQLMQESCLDIDIEEPVDPSGLTVLHQVAAAGRLQTAAVLMGLSAKGWHCWYQRRAGSSWETPSEMLSRGHSRTLRWQQTLSPSTSSTESLDAEPRPNSQRGALPSPQEAEAPSSSEVWLLPGEAVFQWLATPWAFIAFGLVSSLLSEVFATASGPTGGALFLLCGALLLHAVPLFYTKFYRDALQSLRRAAGHREGGIGVLSDMSIATAQGSRVEEECMSPLATASVMAALSGLDALLWAAAKRLAGRATLVHQAVPLILLAALWLSGSALQKRPIIPPRLAVLFAWSFFSLAVALWLSALKAPSSCSPSWAHAFVLVTVGLAHGGAGAFVSPGSLRSVIPSAANWVLLSLAGKQLLEALPPWFGLPEAALWSMVSLVAYVVVRLHTARNAALQAIKTIAKAS